MYLDILTWGGFISYQELSNWCLGRAGELTVVDQLELSHCLLTSQQCCCQQVSDCGSPPSVGVCACVCPGGLDRNGPNALLFV